MTAFILLLASMFFFETATVRWDANSERDLKGYRIYYGTSSGEYEKIIDVGLTTSLIVDGLNAEMTYFFAMTALDSSGNESIFSSEVMFPDDRSPGVWDIVFVDSEQEDIVLEIVAHGNEAQDSDGWKIFGHGNGKDSGLYILNPEKLLVNVEFDAHLMGYGDCLDDPRMIAVGLENFFIGTTWTVVEFTSDEEKIFVNFFDDCYIPDESDANMRIENIRIFIPGRSN